MRFLCCIILMCLSFRTFSQRTENTHYRVYSNLTHAIIQLDDIVNDMGKADVLFFGEEHNDSTAHNLELVLLQKLITRYPARVALSMEMFETDVQPVVNEYLAGLIREKNFVTDTRVWPNYTDYRPLVELVKEKRLNLIAANAPARYTNMVTRLGLGALNNLNAISKAWLPPLPIDTATGDYYKKFAAVMGGHARMPGMELYQSQNLWDATMGWCIAQYLKQHAGAKVLQINGGFHSEEKLGAVAQFKKYNSKATILNIATVSGADLNNTQWSSYNKLADYIIITDFKSDK